MKEDLISLTKSILLDALPQVSKQQDEAEEQLCVFAKSLHRMGVSRDTMIDQIDIAIQEADEQDKPTKVHTFRIVFRREWGDDQGYITKLMNVTDDGNHADMSLIDAILDQIKGEIDQNPAFKDKFRFSHSILFVDGQYYVLGEVDYESSHKAVVDAWKEFTNEQHFQATYDEFGMDGHYELVPGTPELAEFIAQVRRTPSFPIPSWT